MRNRFAVLFLVLLAPLTGCSDSTGPENFTISGTWTSVDFPEAEFSLTVVETARAVEGAGRVVSGGVATAYRVFGANAGQTASLLMDFEGGDDVNFEGEFQSGEGVTILEGLLYGGGFSATPITFHRLAD